MGKMKAIAIQMNDMDKNSKEYKELKQKYSKAVLDNNYKLLELFKTNCKEYLESKSIFR